MKWDKYYYSIGTLRDICASYSHIYQGIEFYRNGFYRYTDTDPWSIAEYKADFDIALQNIGKGKWAGEIEGRKFRDFRYFGRLQQIIIAIIMGVNDCELEGLGFYGISRLRGYAYYLMRSFLNNGVDTNNNRHYNANEVNGCLKK